MQTFGRQTMESSIRGPYDDNADRAELGWSHLTRRQFFDAADDLFQGALLTMVDYSSVLCVHRSRSAGIFGYRAWAFSKKIFRCRPSGRPAGKASHGESKSQCG